MSAARPAKAAVIIPTYNRSRYLRATLDSLAAQRTSHSDFEVVVADDGSTDDSRQVAQTYTGQLRVKYHYQEDLGFRAATARNQGARLTDAPILIFLDTGTLAGPDFVRAHLDAHATHPGVAVIGYVYGYRPWGTLPGLAELLDHHSLEEMVEQYADIQAFQDWRHDEMAIVDFDPNRRAVPWLPFFSLNCSVGAAEFSAVGGFDDDYRVWGGEDLELGFRLSEAKVPFEVSRSAWAIEAPHERNMEQNVQSCKENAAKFLGRHPEPLSEIVWRVLLNDDLWPIERRYRELLDWRAQSRQMHARAELRRAASALTVPATEVAVFGCGAEVPPELADARLFDFDRDIVDQLIADGHPSVHHGIGIRTLLEPGDVTHLIVTSRLAGLWERWRGDVLAEAARIARSVDATPLDHI